MFSIFGVVCLGNPVERLSRKVHSTCVFRRLRALPVVLFRGLPDRGWRREASVRANTGHDDHDPERNFERRRSDDHLGGKRSNANRIGDGRIRGTNTRTGEFLRCVGQSVHGYPSVGNGAVDERRDGDVEVPSCYRQPQL